MIELFDDTTRETLARAAYDDYARSLRDGDGSRSDVAEWASLSEAEREENRNQVDDIPRKLELIGASVRPSSDGVAGAELTPDDIELLARHEHERWRRSRAARGWSRGDDRDGDAMTHPGLVPYDQLSESERDKDRDAVRRIPSLLALAGFVLSRE